MRQQKSSGLRLVANGPALERQKVAESWLLERAPDPLPDHAGLLVKIEGAPPGISPRDLEDAIEALVASQKLARLQIGGVRHITRQSAAQLVSEDEARNRLEVRLDIEAERQLLYRLGLVLESIALGLIVRHAVLESLFPFPAF
ncbi:MAG: hypothetical protein AAF690_15175 [Acidobacteriota bacterium]